MATSNTNDGSSSFSSTSLRRQSSLKLMLDVNKQYQQHVVGHHTPSSSLTSHQSLSSFSAQMPNSPASGRMRRAVRDLIHTVADSRSKRSVYDPRGYVCMKEVRNAYSKAKLSPTTPMGISNSRNLDGEMMSILSPDLANNTIEDGILNHNGKYGSINSKHRMEDASTKRSNSQKSTKWKKQLIEDTIQQISAVAVVALLNMMMSIPFGVSYFPVGWKAETDIDNNDADQVDTDGIEGPFPLPNKQNLGLRMFMLATIIAQLVYTYKSKFVNAIGLQMVENIPFMHALAGIVIKRQVRD